MASDKVQAARSAREADGPTRRQFLGAAGVAAAGTAIFEDIASTSAAGQVQEGKKGQVMSGARSLSTHSHTQRATCLAVTGQNSAVTCDDAHQLLQWDLTTLKPVAPTFQKVRAAKPSYVVVSKTRTGFQVVLTATYDGVVSVHNLTSGERRGVFDDHLSYNGLGTQVWVVAVTPDGATAISGTNTGEIRVWGVEALTTSTKGCAQATEEPVASIAIVSVSAQGVIQFLAGYGDGNMERWQFDTTGGLQRVGPGQYDHLTLMTVNSIAHYMPNSTDHYAVTGSHDTHLRIWDLQDQTKEKKKHRLHQHFVWRVVASSDGKTFASVGEDEQLIFFDFNGTIKKQYKVGGGIMGLDFLPDFTKVAVATGNIWTQDVGLCEVAVFDVPS